MGDVRGQRIVCEEAEEGARRAGVVLGQAAETVEGKGEGRV